MRMLLANHKANAWREPQAYRGWRQGTLQAQLYNRWVVSCNRWMDREWELKYNFSFWSFWLIMCITVANRPCPLIFVPLLKSGWCHITLGGTTISPKYTRWHHNLSQSAKVFFPNTLKAGCWLAIFWVYMEMVPEKYQLHISKYIIVAFYMSYILRKSYKV